MYIPGSKWGRVNPLITGVINLQYLLSGMNHQVSISKLFHYSIYPLYPLRETRRFHARPTKLAKELKSTSRSWWNTSGMKSSAAEPQRRHVSYTSIASLDFPMPYHSSSQWGSVVNPPKVGRWPWSLEDPDPRIVFCGERPYTNSPWILQVPTLKQRLKESSFQPPIFVAVELETLGEW